MEVWAVCFPRGHSGRSHYFSCKEDQKEEVDDRSDDVIALIARDEGLVLRHPRNPAHHLQLPRSHHLGRLVVLVLFGPEVGGLEHLIRRHFLFEWLIGTIGIEVYRGYPGLCLVIHQSFHVDLPLRVFSARSRTH